MLNVRPAFRAPEAFSGTLIQNEVFSALFNMIISQEVFSDNIKGLYDSLVQRYKTDGTLYGDTKLFYATDALASYDWQGDDEAKNLLDITRPKAPEVQAVTIDQFRIIPLTVDEYLTKRAFSDEGTFSTFNGVMKGWMADTKKVHESKLMNAYVGTVEGAATVNSLDITFVEAADDSLVEKEAANRLNASAIATAIADLMDEMKDAERDYNDYGMLRSYDASDLVIVFNSKYANEIRLMDLPTIFHKEGLEPSIQEKLPAKYFGDICTEDDVAEGKALEGNRYAKANGIVVRSCIENTWKVGDTEYHVFPGDELPDGVTVGGSSAVFRYGECYKVNANIIGKILHKKSIPFMGAFEVGTSFWNARSLTENLYTIFGYSELTYLKNYPVITINKVTE